MQEEQIVDVLYTIWQNDNSQCFVHPEDAPLVDRALKQWAESRRDSWVSVRNPSGSDFSFLASTVTSAQLTTAAERANATIREKALDDERRDNRAAAGFIESE